MIRLSLIICLFGIFASGCDEAVVAADDIPAYFTLWGALDPSTENQALRVVPITSEIGDGEAGQLDVAMTSTDLTTNVTSTWRDSVVTFENGTTGHVFLSDFRAQHGRRYRIAVERVDGATTIARVRVPPLVDPFREESEIVSGNVLYPTLWPGAPQLNNIKVTYLLENGNCDRFSMTFPFEGDAEPFEFGWMTTIRLAEDADRVLDALGDRPHAVARITLSAEVASEDWRPPGGVFDPEVFIEPGTFSNVEGGFGFVGGSYEASTQWVPVSDELTRVGFRTVGFGACSASNPSS